MQKKKYYEAFATACGWRGRVYGYDGSGDKLIIVWTSPEEYPSREEAMDAAVEWCEEHDVEAEMD